MDSAKDLFLASLARCQSAPGFIEAFYKRFLASNEELRQRFRFTDMASLYAKVAESMRVCGAATRGTPEGLARLRELGRTHDRLHHDARPEWHALWIDAMTTTASEHDPEWSPRIEAAWRTTLGLVTKRMARFYEGDLGPGD